MGSLSEWIQQGWYKGSPWLVPLRPLSLLVSLEAKRRLQRFRKQGRYRRCRCWSSVISPWAVPARPRW